MKIIFNIKQDDNGINGLMFEGAPSHFDAIDISMASQYYNPMRLVAHDILEHDIKNDDGSVECELMAIGAAMYGRGNHGEIDARGFLGDIVSMARDSMLQLKNTNKGMKTFEPIEWIIEELKNKNLIKEIKNELGDDFKTSEINNFIKLALRYIRIGARRAERRFKNSFDMYNMFLKLTDKLSKVARFMDEFQQLIVHVCFSKLDFKVYTKELTEYNY